MTFRRAIFALLCSLVITTPALVSGCGKSGDAAKRDLAIKPPPPTNRDHHVDVDPTLIEQLAVLTMGMPVDAALGAGAKDRWLADLRSGMKTLENYIDACLVSREFVESVAARVIVPRIYLDRPAPYALGFPLQSTGDGSQRVFYLKNSCEPQKATKVRPWWDRSSEILVCPDAYQPGSPHRYKVAGQWEYCGASNGKDCDCGPSLIRCSSGKEQELRMRDASEIALTVAHVVRSNLPLASLFTMNETVRDWEHEILYRRAEVATNAATDLTPLLDELASWKDPKLRPRHELWPGQHAGLLTTLQVLRTGQDARQNQRAMYDMLWCSTVESRGATAQAVLSLGKSSLQGLHEGWQELARRPVRGTCHARLDYGMQFFSGYADERRPGPYALPEYVRTGQMTLYGRDIDDPRGQEIATPAGFARLATAQPEFASCMSQRVVGHVFGHEATSADLESVHSAYERAPTLKNMLKVALLRYADHWTTARAAAAPRVTTVADAKRLRGLLEEHCFDCHDGEQKPDLSKDLSSETLFKVVTQVSYGAMPKGENNMTSAARDELSRLALASAFAGAPAALQQATAYFDRARAVSVHDIDSAFAYIETAAGRRPDKVHSWALYERNQDYDHDARQWSPDFTAIVGFKALEACRAAGNAGDQLDACLTRALDPAMLAKTTRPITPRP